MQKATQKEHTLLQILQEKFQSIENLRTLAIDSNRELLSFLLESSEFKERFFTRIDSVAVFEKDKFLDFLKLRMLDKSYTAFSNKIGLQLESSFENSQKVVLNFPFKDCVLKGAQSKDEQKSKEIFFNEVLARSEIDVLFARKALQNFESIERQDSFPKSAPTNQPTNQPTERTNERTKRQLKECLKAGANLLIKGNNLLALHSLKKKFANQVKLIYIDPPYNTGNDSFNYNDNFNHSTWLTFMKNRLEIARDFLRDDGVIFIQCDDNEQAYLKVLCDEIFGRENFVRQIIWRIGWVSGFKTAAKIVRNHDTILVYAKNVESLELKKIYLTPQNYQERFNDENRKKIIEKLLNFGINNEEAKKTMQFIETIGLPEKYPLETTWNCNQYDKLNSIAIVSYSGEKMSKMLKTDEFDGQKPEALIKRIIEISTQENDLVMDFFAGSGTTLAVAHKMNRCWIGIEQMEYIESITKERLKKVVSGEQGGISKAVDWQGGGGFIYCELMPLNAVYKEKLLSLRGEAQAFHNQKVDSSVDCHDFTNAKSRNDKEVEKELEKIYNDLESKAFVDYRVDIQAMLKDKEFHALSVDEKLKVLYAILDSNMDYVLYDDIDDSECGVSEELKELNRIFYGENDE